MADTINEETTDLTGDGIAGGAEKPVQRVVKRPAPPPTAPPPHDPRREQPVSSDKKKKKKSGIKLILILVPVVLVVAFVVLLIMNLFGVRDWVGGVLTDPLTKAIVWLNPEFTSIEERLQARGDARKAELDEREADIASRTSVLNERDLANESREQQLNRLSDALDRREQNIEDREEAFSPEVPYFRRPLTEDEIADLQALARSYASMDSESAAEIMAELYSLEDAATILYYMADRYAGAILAAMNPELAARITEVLLENS